MNAEISAFSRGDLNKYEFLARKYLKYKPNALDKARFQFSPLGQRFSVGLDKTVQGYQEEGVMKLLKYIRDSLRGGVRPRRHDDNNNDNDNDDNDNNNDDNDNNNNDDNDNDDNDNDNDEKDKFSEYQEVISSLIEETDNNNKKTNDGSVFINNLNNEISNVKSDGEHYVRLIAYQNATIEKLEKELTDRKNLTENIIDETSKIINENKRERLEYHNKYKNTLFDYIKTLKQLNNAENTFGREIGNLNNGIEFLEDVEEESLEIIDDLNNKLDELKNKKKFLKDHNKKLRKSIDLIKNNNEYLIKENNEIQDKVKKDEAKICNMLDKFNDNMKKNMNNFYEKVKYKKICLKIN